MDTFGEYLGKIMEPKYSEEFMFEFAKWCADNYVRGEKLWWDINVYPNQAYTTKELLEEFKKSKDAVSE